MTAPVKVIAAVTAYVEAAQYAAYLSRVLDDIRVGTPAFTAWSKAHEAVGAARWDLAEALGGMEQVRGADDGIDW